MVWSETGTADVLRCNNEFLFMLNPCNVFTVPSTHYKAPPHSNLKKNEAAYYSGFMQFQPPEESWELHGVCGPVTCKWRNSDNEVMQ